MPTPLKKPQQGQPSKYSKPWHALYKGKWYEVEKVEDPRNGKPNLYKLKGVPKMVEVEDLEPLGVAAKAEEPTVDKATIRRVLAKRYSTMGSEDIAAIAGDIFYSGEPAAVLASKDLIDKLFERMENRKIEAAEKYSVETNQYCPLCKMKTEAVKLAGGQPALMCKRHFVVFPVKGET